MHKKLTNYKFMIKSLKTLKLKNLNIMKLGCCNESGKKKKNNLTITILDKNNYMVENLMYRKT